MITRLTIENFKAFEYAELNLTELNLLTGVNGVGKSSVIRHCYCCDSRSIPAWNNLLVVYC